MTADPREFRRTIGLFATGVTVITVRDGEVVHGMTANAVTSVSLDPLLVLVCIDNRARMRELIPRAGRFAINVLSERQRPLSLHFSGRQPADLEVVFAEIDGVPTLPDSLATLVCGVERVIEGGDHIVVFGRVDALTRAMDGGRPLVYYAGDYQRIAVNARVRRLERQQRERLEALQRLAQVVASSLNVEEVFGAFAQGIAQLVPHDAVSVTLLSEDGRYLERFALATTTHIGPHVGERQELAETAAGIVARDGQSVWTGDMPGDERFLGENDRRWIDEGFRSFISAPLRAKGRLIGALNVLNKLPNRYGEEDVAMVEQIANHVAIFLDNMYLHARLRQLTITEERQRLALAIHDTLVQSLSAIVLRLESAERHLEQPEKLRADVRQARESAHAALREARRGVWELHLSTLDAPLPEALRAWLAEWQQESAIPARLFVRGDGAPPPAVEAAILRIAQEALHNVRKHSQASEARIDLEYGAHEVRLHVSDDGVGFDPQARRVDGAVGNGFGLLSMRERAHAVDGQVSVTSWPGNGTRVKAHFPTGGANGHQPATGAGGQAALPARVLLVDDHPLVRRALVDVLSGIDGVRVVGEASDGPAAIEAARRLHPDLVLMDLRLPGIDGAATTALLRAEQPDLPVIVLTGSDAGDDLARAVQAGARGYLLKESPVEGLAETIRAVLRGEAVIEQRITHHLLERFNHLSLGRHGDDLLSERELEVLALIVEGRRNRAIAGTLRLSEHTVKSHVSSIFRKLGVRDRAEAISVAARRNLAGIPAVETP